jgi:hypothetical protein
MEHHIEIVGAPAFSWGRRTSTEEGELPRRRRRRRGLFAGFLVTFFVMAASAAAGVVLLLADDARHAEAMALVDAPPPGLDQPMLPPLEGLQAPLPLAGTQPPPAEGPAATAPTTTAAGAVVQTPVPSTPQRRTARRARRARTTELADPFRRARRVGRDQL